MKARMLNVSWAAKVCAALAMLACVAPAWALELDYRNSGGNSEGGGTHSESISSRGQYNARVECCGGIREGAVSWVYGGIYYKSSIQETRDVVISTDIVSGFAKWSSWSYAGQAVLWGDFRGRICEWNGSKWVVVKNSTTRFVEKPWYMPAGYKNLNGKRVTRKFSNVTLKKNTLYAFDGYLQLRGGIQGVAYAEIKIADGYVNISPSSGDGDEGAYEEREFLEALPPPPDPMAAPSDIEEDSDEASPDEIELWVDEMDLSELDEDTSDVLVVPDTGAAAPQAAHPDCSIEVADINGDGVIDLQDLAAFFERASG